MDAPGFVDLHADTPLWDRLVQYDFGRAHSVPLWRGAWAGNLDLPRLQQIRMRLQLFGLVALPWEGFHVVQRMVHRWWQLHHSLPGFRLTTKMPEDATEGPVQGMLTLEGLHSLGSAPEPFMARLQWLVEHGVVSFGLTHFSRNAACRPGIDLRLGGRGGPAVTKLGHRAIDYLTQAGRLIDLAHAHPGAFDEVLQQHPAARVFVSHCGVQGVHAIARNLSDAEIRATASRGGIVGVMFSRHFLGGCGLEAVVRHLRHVMRVGGEAACALGSDFDGFIVPVDGLADVTGLPRLMQALHDDGFTPRQCANIAYHNAVAFLKEALG